MIRFRLWLTIDLAIRKRPNIDHLLYDRLPVQCKQCGVRFTDDTLGKKEMEDHLDMHFRQNRKASQNIGRGHSRSWFVDLQVRFLLLLLGHKYSLSFTGLGPRRPCRCEG